MKESDYPALYRSSDACSLKAQKGHLWLQKIYLSSLIIGSIVSASISLAEPDNIRLVYGGVAVILFLGLILLWVSRAQRYDRDWFDCRAVAESVKTATWRYMMKAPSFQGDASVDINFVSELQEIRKTRPGVLRAIVGVSDPVASEITDFMRLVRALTLQERKEMYLNERLLDQKKWYSEKGKAHSLSSTKWFWAVSILQILAVSIAIVQTATAGFGVNIVPIVTTCAAVAVAWTQTKRYDEQAQAYALAANELGALESVAGNLITEEEFVQLVEQTEEAISREHTMWCAKRDISLASASRLK
jgi:hypothetical protein